MKTESIVKTAAGVGMVAASIGNAADSTAVSELIARIRSKDDAVRGPAWQGAGPVGAPAVGPLADVMSDPDFEIARSARRAIERIVRHAGRPGADTERKAVQEELVKLLKHSNVNVRRLAAWMLSEIGDDNAVAPMAELLADVEAREDARCALTRIPGDKATNALRKAIETAPEEFKFALADSLRARGEKVSGYPTRKLVPTKQTTVKAEG
jgi:HEAT repeat protein